MPSGVDLLREWLDGPSFLKTNEYPEETTTEKAPDDDSETITLTTVCDDNVLAKTTERFSNWGKLTRVIMNCLIFSARCRKQPDSDDKIKLHARSERILLKYCQENAFSDDLKQLKTTGQVSTSSKLASLNPHIGSDQLLRVRGRLENADLPPEMKAPIILPSNDHLTHLIIDDLHRKNGHVGLKHGHS